MAGSYALLFNETGSSLLCSQQPATGSYLKPVKSSSNLQTLFY